MGRLTIVFLTFSIRLHFNAHSPYIVPGIYDNFNLLHEDLISHPWQGCYFHQDDYIVLCVITIFFSSSFFFYFTNVSMCAFQSKNIVFLCVCVHPNTLPSLSTAIIPTTIVLVILPTFTLLTSWPTTVDGTSWVENAEKNREGREGRGWRQTLKG